MIFLACNQKTTIKEEQEEENEKYDGALLAAEREYRMMQDPATGLVSRSAIYDAMVKTEELKANLRPNSTQGIWVERGPTSDIVGGSNGNTRANSGVTSGRIRGMWVDLKDATNKTVWVGGVSGGLWKTTDITVASPTWTLVNDFFSNMAVTSICQDPVNKDIMYFATGEAYFNFDAVSGDGVFKSVDGGVNWTRLTSTTGYSCSKILCDAAGNIYLGTQLNGFLRSTAASGGAAWTNITPSGSSARISDIEISSTGRLHVTTGLGNSALGVYRFTDVPATVTAATWTSATVPFPFSSGANCRVEIGCAGNTLYALSSNNGNPNANVTTLYKSTDGGANWAATLTTPAFTSGQAWYCLGVAINPADATQVIVGSLDCYKTINGGDTWTKISGWVGLGGQYVHADQQAMAWWDAGTKLLIASDGGVHYSSDGGTIIRDRNVGLRIKQFYSIAVNPTSGSNVIIGGTQDNGVHRISTAGLASSVEVTGGDGAFVAIDQDAPANEFGSYVFNTFRRSTNSGVNWSTVTFYKGTSGSPSDFGDFINPWDYDNTNNIIYAAADANEFFRWSDPLTRAPGTYYSSTTFGANAALVPLALGSGFVSAVAASPYTNHCVYFGSSNGVIIKATNANAAVPVQADITGITMPVANISCIATGTNDQNLIASFSNMGISSVWVSSNGGTSWTALDPTGTAGGTGGTLPNIPIRWCMFTPGVNSQAIIATETGIWISGPFAGTATTWTPSATFPTVRTDMIKYRASDGMLFAATHGRGIWSQDILSVVPVNNFLLKGKWKNGESVELLWENTTIYPIASYEVESSLNGTNFIKVGTTSRTTFNFTDRPAASNLYYRIKSINSQGGISYSNVILLRKDQSAQEIAALKIFPNPVRDELKLAFATSGTGKVNFKVSAINGQVLWNKDEDITLIGDHIRKWNMNALKAGTYVLTVSFNNKKLTKSFTKQ